MKNKALGESVEQKSHMMEESPAHEGMESASEEGQEETKKHLDHIMKAHEVMSDPKKLAAVHEMVGRHQKALKGLKKMSGPKMSSLADVKEYTQKKYGPKKSSGEME